MCLLLSTQTTTTTTGLQNSSLLYGALSSSRDESFRKFIIYMMMTTTMTMTTTTTTMMMMMMMFLYRFLRVADRRIREGVLQDHVGFPRFFKVSSVHVDCCGVVVMQIVSTSVTVFSALPAAEARPLCWFLFLQR